MVKAKDKFHEDLDQYAVEYDIEDKKYRADLIFKQKIINHLLDSIKGPNILEMGAGVGDWTKHIIERFGNSHVVEGSKKLAERAKETYGENIQCYNEFFENFNPDLKFDTVISSFVLEHVLDPIPCLRNIHNWLKPGGKLIILVPQAGSLHRELAVLMGLQKNNFDLGDSDIAVGHRRVYEYEELKNQLLQANFKNIMDCSMGIKILPGFMMKDLSITMLEAMFDLGEKLPVSQRATLGFIAKK